MIARFAQALAFYFVTPPTPIIDPNGIDDCLWRVPKSSPRCRYNSPSLSFAVVVTHIHKLSELAHDPEHAQVARHASLPLLRAFPTRCKLEQIQSLDYLLWAAIQYADSSSLQELIDRKLSRKSMNDAQRVHWLAASIIVSPEAYNDLLRDFVQDR